VTTGTAEPSQPGNCHHLIVISQVITSGIQTNYISLFKTLRSQLYRYMKEHYNSYKPIPFALILPDKATMMGNPQQALLTPLWNQQLIKPPKLICKNTGKIKPFQASINDADGFRMRAACVCVRTRKEQEVLLVSSTGGRGWIIPGGKVEPREADNPSISAIREAREEGGVLGQLGRYLGEFENTEKGHRTRVFVMYVDSLEPEELWEESIRERKWFTIREAKEVLKKNKPYHVKYIERMVQTKSNAVS